MQVSPLSWAEWKIVLYLSFPVSTLSTLACYAISIVVIIPPVKITFTFDFRQFSLCIIFTTNFF